MKIFSEMTALFPTRINGLLRSRLSSAMFRTPRISLLLKSITAFTAVVFFMFLLNRDIHERRKVFTPIFVDGDDLHFDINQEKCPDNTHLLVYIHSHPQNSERRRVVRSTWASREILAKRRIKLLFITGKVTDTNLQTFLETESELYKDIIQGTFIDTYRNLTLKAITALKWVTEYCQAAMFVLKTDDDVMVATDRFLRLLRSQIVPNFGKQSILSGYIWNNTKVVRDKTSKWYTSYEEYPEEIYLNYCSGSAFFMSNDVVSEIYMKSREIPFFWIDDYFVTGSTAHASNLTHIALNERYVLENENNTRLKLKNDTAEQITFVHAPDTNLSMHIWRTFTNG